MPEKIELFPIVICFIVLSLSNAILIQAERITRTINCKSDTCYALEVRSSMTSIFGCADGKLYSWDIRLKEVDFLLEASIMVSIFSSLHGIMVMRINSLVSIRNFPTEVYSHGVVVWIVQCVDGDSTENVKKRINTRSRVE